jgi:hypothetical protein
MLRKIIQVLLMFNVYAISAGTVTVNFNGLEDLGPDARYEGWLIVGGNPVSTGVFTVDGSGTPNPSSFTVSDADADNATTFVLTIEPFPDADPAPASTHILAGDFANGMANITVDHPAALGDDFTTAAGDYILAVPSDSNMVGSYVNGIWYLTPPNPDPSLSLPTLPPGWAYEGWVVDTNATMPISTGTFTTISGADSDGGGATAGPGATPPFPGQDFINPLRDLTDAHLAVISIEPVPDNSPNPFTLKPLVGSITDPGGAGISQSLNNNAVATNPTGVVSIAGSATSVPSLGFYGMILLIIAVGYVTSRKKHALM